ncbi:1176_t:CDS:1 [Funneliformis caledonium]|uniref:1176_t:CDS:1 n=1 Tax=Funneliformis caledonium TaxID=1117310 RepID=A0A9N9BVX6_9GLOM|nr:1176_t:CDS:1 [Funneliformis caledonium]
MRSNDNNQQPTPFSYTCNNNQNFQHNNNNGAYPNIAAHSAPVTALPHFTSFECYLPSNDGRIYHVLYTELSPLEITRLLNNGKDLSNFPRMIQQDQHPVESQAYQQNNVQNNIQQSNVVISGIMQDSPIQNV